MLCHTVILSAASYCHSVCCVSRLCEGLEGASCSPAAQSSLRSTGGGEGEDRLVGDGGRGGGKGGGDPPLETKA